MRSIGSDRQQMLSPAASRGARMSSQLPAETRQPRTRSSSHVLGERVTCRAASGRDPHADSSTRVSAVIVPLQGQSSDGLLTAKHMHDRYSPVGCKVSAAALVQTSPTALRGCCHCPMPTDGGKIPNHSRLAGTSLGFVAVTNGPPHDSHSKGKAQLLPLLGGSGRVAFDEESLWVSATHTFVSSIRKDVVFLTVCPCFVVTPHLAVSHSACA